MKKILQHIEIIIVFLLIACAIGLFFHAAYRRHWEDAAARALLPSTCVHQWSKWSEPITTSNWYVGTFITQSRTCVKCGEAQAKEIKISAHASN